MLTRLQAFQNIGKFDAATSNVQLPRLLEIYAENGRGKTTLAAIFRSLATGDTVAIAERHRLAALNAPRIVIEATGGPPPATFQNGAWNRTLPDMVVFDDTFIDENVCSGLVVESEHRQKLHELILGAQGVALNRTLQQQVERIEEHNHDLRTKGDAIPAIARGTLTVDGFCALAARDGIDAAIDDAERRLAAAKQENTIRTTAEFQPFGLPAIDLAALTTLLGRDLAELDRAAAEKVQTHAATIGPNAETWLADGTRRIPDGAQDVAGKPCPFCAQDLGGSTMIAHYRAYFGAAYEGLKRDVADAIRALDLAHGGDAPAAFERSVRTASERRLFWSAFRDMPIVDLHTADIARTWATARDAMRAALVSKRNAPLEGQTLPAEARAAVDAYERAQTDVAALSQRLQQANEPVRLIKEQAASGNIATLEADVANLKATKARHSPNIAPLCDAYLAEKAAKAATEGLRDAARNALTQYRTNVFPAYQTKTNDYLRLFNAGFRLDQITSQNVRGGSAATYNVVVNNQAVAVAGGTAPAGQPSFRTVLSAGDRNTLALAFFFASLDQDPNLANKIVVIDDPVSSLDEHRTLTTVQEIRNLVGRTAQVIILSHSKPFLCNIWDHMAPTLRGALQLVRDGDASRIEPWDVTRDMVTEHDRRHELLRGYLAASTPNNRPVAEALRPVLEAFLRVAYPAAFGPGTMLGEFRNHCQQLLGTPRQVLDQADITELRALTEYGNQFHHDTNPAWQTQHINDAELLGYVQRVLAFTQR